MNQTTAVNWKVFQVIKLGCGEPDETIGYYSNRNKAELEMLNWVAKTEGHRCTHEKFEIKEILIQS